MKTKIKGKKPFIKWSMQWEKAKNEINFDQVLKTWKKGLPPDTKRLDWEKKLGYRKNSKDGEDRGEQVHERALLGPKGSISFKKIITPSGKALPFVGIYNDMRCAQDFHHSKVPGQTIADAFGVLIQKDKARPIAVEIKVTNANPWYALVENLKQVKLMRFNEPNLNKFLKGINLPNAKGTWGMVLAPRKYYNKKNYVEAKRLLSQLKKYTEARVAFCTTDDLKTKGHINIIASNWEID